MDYRFSGNSGLKLPILSLGLWHNFGDVDDYNTSRDMICYAFDKGITHFDLANNYGPPPGSAEIRFGEILRKELLEHRDEMIISSKAGHQMWNGPYGDGGSRKSLMASINQSLQRTGLDYFDIFYSHRYDWETPIQETMQALSDIVHQGKALYIGLSKYPTDILEEAIAILKENKTPCIIYQDRYSMFTTDIEKSHFDLISNEASGFIAFSPLAQGLLSSKYLNGIPQNSRAAKETGFLKKEQITPEKIDIIRSLNDIAHKRGQSLAQMAIAWTLRDNRTTSSIVGASSVVQLKENIETINNLSFSSEELCNINSIIKA